MIPHPITGEILPDDLEVLERAERTVDKYLRGQGPHYRFRDELRRRIAELRGPSRFPSPRHRTPHQHRAAGCPRCSVTERAAREAAWAAGVYDLRGRAEGGDAPRLTVRGKPDVLERVRAALGGEVYAPEPGARPGGHAWIAEGAEARDVAARLAPWLAPERVAGLRRAGLLP